MTNKPRYPTSQVIKAIRDTKGLVSLAALKLGCDPDTVRSYAKRYPTVAVALKEERSRMTDVAELALYDRILAGDGWAVCFYLKTQGRDRGYIERHEVTGADGKEIVLRVIYDDEKATLFTGPDNDNRQSLNGNRPALGSGE